MRMPISNDRVRPGYPEQLFNDLFTLGRLRSGSAVAEIGCGTGQATLPVPFYRLRHRAKYRQRRIAYRPTQPTAVSVGERRRPEPNGHRADTLRSQARCSSF
jgi:hypothetical protein